MNTNPIQFSSVPPLAPPSSGTGPAVSAGASQNSVSFDQVFETELHGASEVKMSAHALQRLSTRNITLGQGQMDRLAGAVDRAAAKGAHDSLIMVDDVAMVVNIPNRTVVTAMGKNDAGSAVFTKIDSAVIA